MWRSDRSEYRLQIAVLVEYLTGDSGHPGSSSGQVHHYFSYTCIPYIVWGNAKTQHDLRVNLKAKARNDLTTFELSPWFQEFHLREHKKVTNITGDHRTDLP